MTDHNLVLLTVLVIILLFPFIKLFLNLLLPLYVLKNLNSIHISLFP